MQPLLCRVMVGRDDALAAVAAALTRAASGRGGVMFAVGEAGIGKSRLAREARALAEVAGMTVLWGRGVDRSAPPPYRPLVEALQPALSQPVDGHEDGPGAPFRRALRSLLGGTSREAVDVGELAVAEALTRLLGTIGTAGRSRSGAGGCLLLLEDLHWADPETLAVVEYLADHVGDQPVLVMATVRSGEASGAERLAVTLRERRGAEVVALQRLAGDAADAMLTACLGSTAVSDEIRDFVHDHAEGVPLFVEELLSGLAESGALVHSGESWTVAAPLTPVVPLTYAESIRRRLHGMAPRDREVILAAAVLGRRFAWAVLAPITGHGEANVLEALRRATAGLLVEPDHDADIFRFRHALSRDAVLAELLPPEQATIAAKALVALEAGGPEGADTDTDLVAELAERAGDRPRAVSALLTGAQNALARGALTSAATALERAARLAAPQPQLAILVEEVRAHAAALAGDVDDAIRRAALVLADLPAGSASNERRARLHLTLARAASVAGRWADASRHVADALSLTTTGHPALRVVAEALAAHVAIGAGRNKEAVVLATSAVNQPAAAGVPAAVCEALEVLGRVARMDDLAEGERVFTEALAVAERHGLALWRARALHELATIDLYSGRRQTRFEAARAAAVDAGAFSTIALCDLHLTAGGYAQWDPAPGIAAGHRCVELSRRLGLDTLGMALVHLATCHAAAGEVDAMEAVLRDAAPFAAVEPDVAVGIPGRARMVLAVRQTDLAGARAALDEAMAIIRSHPKRHFPFAGLWALLCTIDDSAGGGAAARTEAAGAGAGALFNGFSLALAEAAALGRAGRHAEAMAALEPFPVDELEVEAKGAWEAIALAAAASSALRHGWGHGDRWARTALDSFTEHGLDELASWCRSMLRAAGQPVPRRGRDSTPSPSHLRALGVTSREADVLRLIATGASNKEIAERLYLSPRTVERHVSNLLTKTGTSDRRALSRLAP